MVYRRFPPFRLHGQKLDAAEKIGQAETDEFDIVHSALVVWIVLLPW